MWRKSWCLVVLGLAAAAPRARASHLVPSGTDEGVELKSLSIYAAVSARGAKTVLYMRFANRGSRRTAQATILFPVPPGAAVQRLRLRTGDRWMEGEVTGRVQGKAVYDRLRRRAIDPALLAQAGESQYRLRVFPIPAHGAAEVEITYWHLLPEDDGTLLYSVPFDLPEARAVARSMPVSLHLTARGLGRCRVRTPEDWPGARVEAGEARVVVTCPERRMDLAGAIETALTPKRRPAPLVARRAAGQGHFYLQVRPEPLARRGAVRRRFILCLDRSGSMRGEKIAQAREALSRCIDALQPDDEFNIVSFSGEVRPFTDRMEAAAEMRAAAKGFVENIQAGGNTDIRGALLAALRIDGKGEGPLDIILISDGQQTVGASTAEAVLEPVRAAAAKRGKPVRISVVGIGRDVDAALLRRLARDYEGERAFVTAEHAVAGQIRGVLAQLQASRMERVRVSVEGARASLVTPAHLPNASFDAPLTVAGTYAEPGDLTVKLAWHEGARERSWKRAFRLPKNGTGYAGAPLLAAAACADALELEITQSADESGRVAKIVRVGRRYRLVTRYTALIALETDDLYRQQGVARPERDELGIAGKVDLGDFEIERRFDRQPADEVAARATQARPRDLYRRTLISDHMETDNDMDAAAARGDENALSTVPLGGTGVIGTIGVGGGGAAGVYGFRDGGGRRKCIMRYGGSSASESAVEAALKWLAASQEPDGSWDLAKHGARERIRARATGLAVLAFFGAGYTQRTGKHKENVQRALGWIAAQQQSDGSFRVEDAEPHRAHAILTLALSEAYGMTRDARLRAPAQKALDHAVKLQAPYAGWGRRPRAPQDTTTTAWFVLAFKSAKVAGLNVHGAVFQGAMSYLEKAQARKPKTGYSGRPGRDAAPDPASSMAGACAMTFLGCRPGDPEVAGIARWAASEGARQNLADDPEWLYFGSLVHFQISGDLWKSWNNRTRDRLVGAQIRNGDLKGSWRASGAAGARGRVWTTAMNALCLEVYYRYLQMYE